MSGGNWWEYYFVRYFIGSVFGAIIAFGLLLHPDSGIHYIVSSFMVVDGFSLRDVSMPLLFMVLCLGVAFCYLSSAPILVLHSIRYSISYGKASAANRKPKMLLLVMCLVLWAGLNYTLGFGLELALYSLFAHVVVFIQLCALVPFFLVGNKDEFYEFYSILSRRRASCSKAKKEYIESYRHLREHGNAFFILTTECILGIALFHAISIANCMVILLLWLLPSIITWFMASYLESRLGDV